MKNILIFSSQNLKGRTTWETQQQRERERQIDHYDNLKFCVLILSKISFSDSALVEIFSPPIYFSDVAELT
jgi:hypothetical protein